MQAMHPADEAILDAFDRTRQATAELLKRTPDDLLPRIPPGAEKSLAWEFWHIADGVYGWMTWCMEGGSADDELPHRFANADLLSLLESTRVHLLDYFRANDGEAMGRSYRPASFRHLGRINDFTGRERVLYLIGHEVHHRGKIVLALRQLGFTDVPFIPYPHRLVETDARATPSEATQ